MTQPVPTGDILIRNAHLLTQDPEHGELIGDLLIATARSPISAPT